jgi:tetratricopeptide (TPR) repeat protein
MSRVAKERVNPHYAKEIAMNKWGVVAVLILLVGVVSAQLPPGGEEYKAGEEAIKKGDMDTAITSFESAISANPDLFASHYYLGWAYQSKRDFAKTAEHFVKFLDKVNNDPKAAEWIANATREGGLALARTKQYNEAISLLEKAMAAKPNDAEVIYYLGTSEMLVGNEPAAEQHFAKVNQLQPALDRPYYYAGRIAYNKEDMANAKPRLEKYLELKPDGEFAPDAHFMLGSMAMRRNQKATAKSHLQQFLRAKPDAQQAPQAHYILGSLAAEAEQLETARRHFQRYLQLEPTGPQAEEIKMFLADLK